MLEYRIGDKSFKISFDIENDCYHIDQDVFGYGMESDWLEAAGLIDWDGIEFTLPKKPHYDKAVYRICFQYLKRIDECDASKLAYYVGCGRSGYDTLDIDELTYGVDWTEEDLKGLYEDYVLNAVTYMAFTEPARIGMKNFIYDLKHLIKYY